jgi:cytochrome c peroxidase
VQTPFGGREGGVAALTEQEIVDIVTFLHTLNDGFKTP